MECNRAWALTDSNCARTSLVLGWFITGLFKFLHSFVQKSVLSYCSKRKHGIFVMSFSKYFFSGLSELHATSLGHSHPRSQLLPDPLLSLFWVPFSSSTHQMPLYDAWSHGCVTLHWNMVGLPLAAVLKWVLVRQQPAVAKLILRWGWTSWPPPLSVLALLWLEDIWGLCVLSPPLWAHMRSYHVFSFRKYFSWNINS